MRLPEGTTLSARPVGDTETANLSVTPVSLQRSTFSNQQRIAVTAGVVNHGPAAVKGVELSLELGGRGVQTRRVDVEPGGSASATFDPVTVAEKNVRAAVRLPKDALERDNVFNFVASPDEPVRVVLAERPGAPRDGSLYLTRALAVGEAPRFEVTARGADGLSAEDLAKASVVVLNDVAGLVPARRAPDPLRRGRRRPAGDCRRQGGVGRRPGGAPWRSRERRRPHLRQSGPAGRARVRASGAGGVPCAAHRRLRRGPLLRLSGGRGRPGHAGPGPLRRRRGGAAGAAERSRPGPDVDLVHRHLLERSRGPTGVSAADAPPVAIPWRLQRARPLAHRRRRRRCPGRQQGGPGPDQPRRADSVGPARVAGRGGARSAGVDRAGVLRDPRPGARGCRRSWSRATSTWPNRT